MGWWFMVCTVETSVSGPSILFRVRKGESPGESLLRASEAVRAPPTRVCGWLVGRGGSAEHLLWADLAQRCYFLSSLPWLSGLPRPAQDGAREPGFPRFGFPRLAASSPACAA